MTGPKAVRKKNNYFCVVGASLVLGDGITTVPKQIIIYFFYFRARLRLVILVISAIRAQETGSVGCFAAKNEDAKQYHLIPPKRVLFL